MVVAMQFGKYNIFENCKSKSSQNFTTNSSRQTVEEYSQLYVENVAEKVL